MIKSINEQGNVTFRGFEFNEYAILLCSMINMNDNIPDIEKRRIVHKAPFNVSPKNAITPNSLLKEINIMEHEYLSRPTKKYMLITSMSANRFAKLKRFNDNKCNITFVSHLKKDLMVHRDGIIKVAKNSLYAEIPMDYIYAKIFVSAKSDGEAANKALDCIDFMRGIWNWFYNRRSYFRVSGGKIRPINKFILGPLHTLHELNGKPATDSWWYQQEYREALWTFDPDKDIPKIYRFTENVRKYLRKCRYPQDMKSLIVRYTRSLDTIDLEDSFLKLWSVLEQLTDTGSEGYETTIRRASFIFTDHEFSRQVLNHLKEYRNRAVHASSPNYDIEGFVFQLKRYVEALMEFHLANKFRFESIKSASEFLDMPKDTTILRSRIRLMNLAKIYIFKSKGLTTG